MPKEVTREARKNRHSPYPVPSSAADEPPPPNSPPQPRKLKECIKIRTGQLLRQRELYGDVIISRGRSDRSFRSAEYRKCHATNPTIWNYDGTKNKASVALEHAVAGVQLSHGLVDRDILPQIPSPPLYSQAAALLAGSCKASPQSCELPTFKASSSIPENDPLPNPKPPSGGAAAADEEENSTVGTGSSAGIIEIGLSSDNNIFQVDFSVRSVEPRCHRPPQLRGRSGTALELAGSVLWATSCSLFWRWPDISPVLLLKEVDEEEVDGGDEHLCVCISERERVCVGPERPLNLQAAFSGPLMQPFLAVA